MLWSLFRFFWMMLLLHICLLPSLLLSREYLFPRINYNSHEATHWRLFWQKAPPPPWCSCLGDVCFGWRYAMMMAELSSSRRTGSLWCNTHSQHFLLQLNRRHMGGLRAACGPVWVKIQCKSFGMKASAKLIYDEWMNAFWLFYRSIKAWLMLFTKMCECKLCIKVLVGPRSDPAVLLYYSRTLDPCSSRTGWFETFTLFFYTLLL